MFTRSHPQTANLWRRWVFLPALFALIWIESPAAVHEMREVARKPVATRELIVRFRQDADPGDKLQALKNSAVVTPLVLAPAPGRLRAANQAPEVALRVEVRAGVEVDSELARLELNPAVEYVEPNYPIKLFAPTNQADGLFPDDFEFPNMYGLHNSGGENGTAGADISAPEAWQITTGDEGVIVAVIDTGIDYLHEDLKDNLWINAGEIPANGLDDDGNGFVDDYYGYDFVSNDSDPFDDNQHGTHVAGTIGARGNNGIGTVGVCWEVSLMAVKAFDESGNGTVADAIAAISYAVRNGARVINASWGLDERSRALEDAARHAADAGVLLVAAAGNNRSEAPSYPASFETVLSVGATDANDSRAGFSNFGPYVDVAAPGAEIVSTLPENGYGVLSGTSMAAPHVSGMAALVLARFPFYTRQELFDILVNSVDPLVFDQPIGNGRINLVRAVQTDQPLPTARLSAPDAISGTVELTGQAAGSFFSGYSVSVGAGRTPSSWIPVASATTRVTDGILARFDSALVPDGSAVLRLVVTNQNGATATVNSSIRVYNALITFPLSGDILAPDQYQVRGTIHGPDKTYELSYGAGLNPTEWVEIASGGSGLIDAPIASWDASDLPSGYYALRLAVSNGGVRSEFTAPAIYLDHRLKPGWPVYMPADNDFPTTEWRNIRPADLDGDGISELVLVDAGTRNREQQLRVFSLDGQPLWSRVLGFDIPPDLPVMGDVDGDGRKEIFVDGTNGVAAFHSDGTPVIGWPVGAETRNHAKVLADLDNDGQLELITYSQEYAATQVAETRELAIYTHDGILLRKWPLSWCGFTNDVQKISPAVANLDDDPDLEIVVPAGCSELFAFDYDRAEPKWMASVVGKLLSSPVIGDVDGNGFPDVIAAVYAEEEGEPAGIYIFNHEGQPWRGWPVLEHLSFLTPPALGDLDGDGRLEIVLADDEISAALHAVQWDGFELDGWPLKVFANRNRRAGVTIGDIDNAPGPEVIVGIPGYPSVALSQRNLEFIGGIFALNSAGQELPWNGPGAYAGIPFESVGQFRFHKAAPVILGDLDGNGRADLLLSSIQDRTFGSFAKLKNRSSLYLWELDAPAGALDWPMFGNNIANSGAYSLSLHPTPVPTNVTRAIRDRIIVDEDREHRIEPLTNDWNATGSPLELLSFTTSTNGTVRREGNALVYLPHTNYSGMDELAYTVRDARGTTSAASILLRVKPLNDRPIAEDLEITMKKNTSADIFYRATDSENDEVTFRIVSPPQNGELWNYPGVGNYYPTRGYHGTDSISYVANDGRGDSAIATVSITILNSNNPPEAVSQAILTKTNRAVFILPAGNDPDDDPLRFEIVRPPVNGTVAPEENGFQFTPARDFVGEDSFTFRAHDGTVFSGEAAITIGVIATNATPRAKDTSVVVQPNALATLRLTGADPDGDPITYTLVSQPIHGTLSGAPPELSYLPETNYLGPDRFEFQVSDGFAHSDPATLTIQVERQNRAPESVDQFVPAEMNQPVTFGLRASDPDSDPVRVVILKGPGQGLIYGLGTNLTYVPRPGLLGSDRFTYKLWDGQKFGNITRVTMTISDPSVELPPAFTRIEVAGGIVQLELSVARGEALSVHGSTNLLDWFPVEGPVVPMDETHILLDTNPVGPRRFYRAVRP